MLSKYDIRYNHQTLDKDIAYDLGCRFANFALIEERNLEIANLQSCVIGWDARPASQSVKDAFVKGILACGLNVVELGIVPTPVVYFAEHHIEKALACIAVTGSHNDEACVGFKLSFRKRAVCGSLLKSICLTAKQIPYNQTSHSTQKNCIIEAYIQKIFSITLENIPKKKCITRVVWDLNNGTACSIAPLLVQTLNTVGIESIILNYNATKFSKNYDEEKNLKELKQTVHKYHCDLGFAFDADADRLLVVLPSGKTLRGDDLLLIFGLDLLKHQKEALILLDIKSSQAIIEKLQNHGGRTILCGSGHSRIKLEMAEKNALLAGEYSNHIFFSSQYYEHYGFDDAIMAACKLLAIYIQNSASLEATLNSFKKTYLTPLVKVNCKSSIQKHVIGSIRANLRYTGVPFLDLDGIRCYPIRGSSEWWMLRSSGTEECLMARVEAYTLVNFKKLKLMLLQQIALVNLQNENIKYILLQDLFVNLIANY